MASKLDVLARKEAELKRLNEQLDERQARAMPSEEVFKPTEVDIPETPPAEEDPQPEPEPVSMEPEVEEEKEMDHEFESALSEVEKYREVVEQNREQAKTITFQKAKIEAMQFEIDTAAEQLGEKEAQLMELQREGKTTTDDMKKATKTIADL